MGQCCSYCSSLCFFWKRKVSKSRLKNRRKEVKVEEPKKQNRRKYKCPEILDQRLKRELSTDRTAESEFQKQGLDYENKEEISKGSQGTVYKITRIEDNQLFALKEISLKDKYENTRDNDKYENLMSEIYVLETITDDNVIKLIDNFIVNQTSYLLMEWADGGTVYEEMKDSNTKAMSENSAKIYFTQIAHVVQLLHLREEPIAHMDLKLPNILIHNKDNKKVLKVADFGSCRVLTKDKNGLFRQAWPIGTDPYMSPQLLLLVIRRETGDHETEEFVKLAADIGRVEFKDVNPLKADIWALGVCLFYMVSGEHPFEIKEKNYLNTIKQMYKKDRKPIANISTDLKDLFGQMFEPYTSKRIDISGILKHKWITHPSKKGVSDPVEDTDV